MTTAAHPVVWVRMGECVVGRQSDVLKATLGSCVGLAIVWPQRGMGALAHCLLPAAPAGLPGPHRRSARYVDRAVPALLQALAVPPALRHELQVHLCGGAQMQMHRGPGHPAVQVGPRNTATALQCLADAGLALQAADTGGHCARQIVVDCASGLVRFVRVAAVASAAADAPQPAADAPPPAFSP